MTTATMTEAEVVDSVTIPRSEYLRLLNRAAELDAMHDRNARATEARRRAVEEHQAIARKRDDDLFAGDRKFCVRAISHHFTNPGRDFREPKIVGAATAAEAREKFVRFHGGVPDTVDFRVTPVEPDRIASVRARLADEWFRHLPATDVA